MSITLRTDFDSSAKRHIADAELLHSHLRPANADHLAGLAAECALKALIAGYLGGCVQNGFVVHPDTGESMKQHVNNLWPEMSIIARNGSVNALVPLLTSHSPFADWKVEERYCDGSHLTPAAVIKHIFAARTVVGILERACLDGILR